MTWEEIDKEVAETTSIRDLVYRKQRLQECYDSAAGVAENRRLRIDQLEARVADLEAHLAFVRQHSPHVQRCSRCDEVLTIQGDDGVCIPCTEEA